MKNILYSTLFALLFVAVSCEKYEPGGTATQNLSGDWWIGIEYFDESTSAWVAYQPVGTCFFTTYNTAANVPTEIFIDDHYEGSPTFWDMKGKVKANAGNFSFGSTDTVTNLSYDDSQFIVTDGKVIKGVGRSKTGVITDSIVFVVKFNDDSPAWATEYRLSGHRRTGFNEDEY
jgi:hypothetical protein